MKTINFGGASFNLHYLEMILKEINDKGEVTIINFRPGTVNFLEIGATLSEMTKENLSVDK